MSTLVDPTNEPGDVAGLEKSLTEAVTSTQDKAPDKVSEAPSGETAVPDKYQGKTVTDIIEMHQNAESRLGQLGNELGTKNQQIDVLLDLKRTDDLVKGGASTDEVKVKIPEISSADLLDNPTKVLSQVAEAIVERGNEDRDELRGEVAMDKLETQFTVRHPDAGVISNDPKFHEWVKKDPLRLDAAQAAMNKDWGKASILLDQYKKASEATADVQDEDTGKDPNLEAAKNASTVSVGNSAPADAPTGKTYRRVDLIQLKLTKPEVYADPGFQAEIMRAYNEGRVK